MIQTFPASQLKTKGSELNSGGLSNLQISLLEISVVLAFALLPLFLKYPYRINIFLSWEGAYRLSLGQIPYKDFGLPLGFAYWLLPALFFKVFGPYLFTLVKVQVLINFVAAIAFRSILKTFSMEAGKRLVLVLFFCLTYSFFNFWPWYNHSVFVFELIGIALLLHAFQANRPIKRLGLLVGAAVFVLLSFYTKQDGGGLAFVLCTILASVKSISSRKPVYVAVFVLSFLLIGLVSALPFLSYDLLYWFNLGQAPHYSRMSAGDILNEFLGKSHWLKFYMVVISLLYFNKIHQWKDILANTQETLFYLLSMGILVQATIIQVTSYIPPDTNIYFHSFALAYAMYAIPFRFSFRQLKPILASVVIIFFWWSGVYYKYVKQVTKRLFPTEAVTTNPNIVSKGTYAIGTGSKPKNANTASWIELPESPAFAHIYMPRETVAGIERLRKMPLFNSDSRPKVLNMTELTPLAHELGFALETGQPLWYHLNVSMFEQELNFFSQRVRNHYYDVVLFEYVPNLNNFYPFELQEVLKQEYELVDKFAAPRKQHDAFIEVYRKL